MTKYAKHVNRRKTAQSKPIPGKQQHENEAGGFVYAIAPEQQLLRFLILGHEGGTYYASEEDLTIESAKNIEALVAADGLAVVKTIVEVSQSGRAPKNEPAIFALALCAAVGSPEVKTAAFAAVPAVCRIGTHLFQFAEAVQSLRGWGRGLRNAVGRWYNEKSPKALAYQMTKYQSREGWSHADLLKLAHPTPISTSHDALFLRATKSSKERKGVAGELDPVMMAYLDAVDEVAKCAKNPERASTLIAAHRLPREVLPTELLNEPSIWEALLNVDMPYTALIRNLGNLSKCGLLVPMSNAVGTVAAKLGNGDVLRKARVHPLSILVALNTYQLGHGVRGSGEWKPVTQIVDVLDAAFYQAFGNVAPIGKRVLFGLDWSGSMGSPELAGMPGITPAVGAATMALVTARTEKQFEMIAFATNMKSVTISPRERLDDVIRKACKQTGEGTDCAVPIAYAIEDRIGVDVFVIYTDSQTWAGNIHASQALDSYRQRMGIPAKLVVVAMTDSRHSIADPSDPGVLNVVGFDTNAPAVISEFARSL